MESRSSRAFLASAFAYKTKHVSQTDTQTDKVYSYIDVEKSAGVRQTNSKGL